MYHGQASGSGSAQSQVTRGGMSVEYLKTTIKPNKISLIYIITKLKHFSDKILFPTGMDVPLLSHWYFTQGWSSDTDTGPVQLILHVIVIMFYVLTK